LEPAWWPTVTSGDAQGGLERLAQPPTVALVLVVEAENHAGPVGQPVAATERPRVSHVPLALADPLGSLLPHSDPFREPGQVGAGGDAQSGLERLVLPLVPVVAGVEAKRDPGPFGQQVGAPVRCLPKLRDRSVDVQR
jgi:hypothetical protein